MNIEQRIQASVDNDNLSLPFVFIPKNISQQVILKRIERVDLAKPEKDLLKAVAFSVGQAALEGDNEDGILISIDDICLVLDKSASAIRRVLSTTLKKGSFTHVTVNINSGYGLRASKYFHLVLPDIDTLNKASNVKDELPTFVPGGTMFSPLKKGEAVNSALMDEIITGILAPCLHLQQKGNREKVLVNTVTLLDKKIQVTTRGLSGIDIAHVLDLRYYIAMLSCVERVMRGAIEENTLFTETFSLPISDIVRSMNKNNYSSEKKLAIDAINRLRSTSFELNDMPSEITENYEIDTDGGLWTIDPLSNVSFSKLDTSNGQQIVTFQLPSIIASALLLRSKQESQSILRLISPVMYTEKNLLFVFLLQVRRLIQQGQERIVPWYLMRDYSSPSTDIFEFKKRLSKLLSVHKGTISKEMNSDSILTQYEGNIDGFNIKIVSNDFTLGFDPNDTSLIDPLYTEQFSLFN